MIRFGVRELAPLFCALGAGLWPALALGAGTAVDVNSLLPAPAVQVIVTTLAVMTEHRPYQGATLVGDVDIGLEATLIHLPDNFASSLSDAGFGSGSSLANGAFPMAKLHIHKSLGTALDLGFSGLYYKTNSIIGFDAKVPIWRPEEGLMWALRLNYESTHLDLQSLGLSGIPIVVNGVNVGTGGLIANTGTWGLQTLASLRVDFAEPYIGFGVNWAQGQLEFPVQVNVLPDTQTLDTSSYSAWTFEAFTGVSFRVPHLGLHIDIEGAYSLLGMHSLGLVAGLQF